MRISENNPDINLIKIAIREKEAAQARWVAAPDGNEKDAALEAFRNALGASKVVAQAYDEDLVEEAIHELADEDEAKAAKENAKIAAEAVKTTATLLSTGDLGLDSDGYSTKIVPANTPIKAALAPTENKLKISSEESVGVEHALVLLEKSIEAVGNRNWEEVGRCRDAIDKLLEVKNPNGVGKPDLLMQAAQSVIYAIGEVESLTKLLSKNGVSNSNEIIDSVGVAATAMQNTIKTALDVVCEQIPPVAIWESSKSPITVAYDACELAIGNIVKQLTNEQALSVVDSKQCEENGVFMSVCVPMADAYYYTVKDIAGGVVDKILFDSKMTRMRAAAMIVDIAETTHDEFELGESVSTFLEEFDEWYEDLISWYAAGSPQGGVNQNESKMMSGNSGDNLLGMDSNSLFRLEGKQVEDDPRPTSPTPGRSS